MDMVFKFRDGSHIQGDPQAIGLALHTIGASKNGLKPADVVEVAKSPRHVLHRHFEWDDTKAAVEYRLQQARILIGSVVMIETERKQTRPVRAFIHIGDSYHPVSVVMSNALMREQALHDVRAAIKSLREKLASFEELQDILDALDVVDKLAEVKISPTKKDTPVAGRGRRVVAG